MGAIELGERMCVFRKVRRHPVHDHADASLMTFVDKMTDVVGRAEPARGRKIIFDLITPRTFEGMLRNRKQFDMCVTEVKHVRQKRIGELEISELPISFFPTP